MKTITVRLLDMSAVNQRKIFLDLDIVFIGSVDACHKYCQMIAGYEFMKDSSIYGGYYANKETGDCFVLV